MPWRQERERKKAPKKGHFAVYVGHHMKRYVVPTSFLRQPLFQQLLERSAEEFGFNNDNGIVLPCDEATFRQLIDLLSNDL